MKQELQEKLFNRFSFINKGKSPQEFMYFGIEVGDGWFYLLWTLCEGLEKLGFDGTINQVKEKFGGLRFYVSHCTSEQDDLISKAEKDSYKICEVCGKEGEVRKGGWLETLCDGCHDESKKV